MNQSPFSPNVPAHRRASHPGPDEARDRFPPGVMATIRQAFPSSRGVSFSRHVVRPLRRLSVPTLRLKEKLSLSPPSPSPAARPPPVSLYLSPFSPSQRHTKAGLPLLEVKDSMLDILREELWSLRRVYRCDFAPNSVSSFLISECVTPDL